jgi:nucleoid-associated protein YgaU
MATDSQPTIPAPAWPTSAAEPQRAQPADPAQPRLVTVRPGDSLWGIAAARLGSDASAGAITASWRHIYAGNRRLIGPDPGVIRPGQQLQVDDDSAAIPR